MSNSLLNSFEEQINAFEDYMDSEVGDTPLVRARNLERMFGLRQLYLKFEGGNPTGTQKDRIAFAQCMDALRRGYDTVAVATCGNYGAAMAQAAKVAGLKCVVHMPAAYHSRRLKELATADLQKFDGDYEATVAYSQAQALAHEWYDGNPGGDNTILQLQAYGEIAYEIYDELRDAPKQIAVPVSNGTVLAGIYRGYIRLHRRGKISRIPELIAGSAFKKNPIIRSWIEKKTECVDLRPEEIKETLINEPLINWHAFDGDYALDAIYESKGKAYDISDKKMQQFSRIIREEEGLNVLPAATAGLIGLIEQHQQNPLPPDRYVAVLTSRNT